MNAVVLFGSGCVCIVLVTIVTSEEIVLCNGLQ